MGWSRETTALVGLSIAEDLGDRGDVSSRLLESPDCNVFAHVVARRPGVVAGLALGPAICAGFAARLDTVITFTPWHEARSSGSAGTGGHLRDGAEIRAGQVLAEVQGPRAAVLAVERTLLNFLSRMSGVATLTRAYVDAARAGSPTVQILDTRKTIPGWRELDKYSVRCGGGTNHRWGLYDAVLIKDNHLSGVPTERLASVLFALLGRVRSGRSESLPEFERTTGGPNAAYARRSNTPDAPAFVEVEVDSLDQLREVCKVVGVDIVLLDNFTPEQMRAAVKLRDELGLRGKVALEASGGVTLATVAEIAATGIERVSVGALTHSAPGLDIALDFAG